jgi:hypothetical protein
MRLRLAIAVIAIVAGLVLWPLSCGPITVWDGGFDLTVNVSVSAGTLRSVSCQVCGQKKEAEFILEHLVPPNFPPRSCIADPFIGQTMIVDVPLSGRDSAFGRELQRTQFRYLVVIGQFDDGSTRGKLAEIPDCRISREVTVTLP